MTRVDFYVLQDVEQTALHRFACRLAAKAVGTGHGAYLHAASDAQAREVDELLWHYPPNRMIPHGLLGEPAAEGAPVVIGVPMDSADRLPADGLLINLADEVPAFPGRFDRIAEIVVGEKRASGRTRYRYYRDRGYPLFHHDLDDWEAR